MDNKQEILDHLLFWQWEYDRRHSPQSHTCKFEKTGDPWVFAITPCEDNDPDADALRYDPVASGHAYGTSDDIIDALINKTFRPLYPPYMKNAPTDTGITRLIDKRDTLVEAAKTYQGTLFEAGGDLSKECGYVLPFLENHFSPGTEVFTIDLNRPLVELMAELKAIHTYFNRHGNTRPWCEEGEMIFAKYGSLAKNGKIINSLEARAIGLWIYDQLQLGRTNQSALARELMEREGFDSLSYYKGIVQYASPWVNQTKKSIALKTILPIR